MQMHKPGPLSAAVCVRVCAGAGPGLVAGPRIQCSVNALICSFGIRRNLEPGNKTIKTICNFDMFIRCSLSRSRGGKRILADRQLQLDYIRGLLSLPE